MVMYVILAVVTLIVLAVAAYTDLRTREVPDWVSYSLLFSALGLRALFSIELGWQVLVSGVLGFLVFFLIALLFYHTRQWGGADSKLLMGLGAVLGLDVFFTGFANNHAWDLPLFFVMLLLAGAVYGLIWSGILITINWKQFYPVYIKKFHKHNMEFFISIFLAAMLALLAIWSVWFILLAAFPIFAYFFFTLISAVEDSCFVKKIRVSKLTEGDWLAKDVHVNDSLVMTARTLERKDLHKLLKLALDNKLKYVIIKEGIPFVPSFLLAYILLLLGDWIFPGLLSAIF
ncbi:MAG: A24 family peptidase [archaeon]|nr:A24 family peptidase [Nanoarchaeota archaeon]